MTSDLTPVHLSERDGHISILMLLGDAGEKLAIYEGDVWHEIGQVRLTSWFEKGRPKTGWAWHYDEQEFDGKTGFETTKSRAIQAVLDAGGYIEADENATIPDLFDME